jgi:hypothetical protein
LKIGRLLWPLVEVKTIGVEDRQAFMAFSCSKNNRSWRWIYEFINKRGAFNLKSIIIISILRDLVPPSPTPGTSCLCSKLIKQISEQLAVKYRLGSHAAELVYFKPLSQWLLVVGVLAETYEVNQSMVRYLEELKDKTECEPGPRHTGASLGVLGPDLHILRSPALAPAGAHLFTQARL